MATEALAPVLSSVIADEALMRSMEKLTPELSMFRPPPLLMVITPTLGRLAKAAELVSEPLAKASWARLTVKVPVKLLLAVFSVRVLATAVPLTTSAPEPVMLPE